MIENQLQELQDLKNIIIATAKLMGYTIDTSKHTIEIYEDPAETDWPIMIIKLYEYSNHSILKTRVRRDERKTFTKHEEKVRELNRLLQNL